MPNSCGQCSCAHAGEFVNPKYADASKTAFKSSTRLECMMQVEGEGWGLHTHVVGQRGCRAGQLLVYGAELQANYAQLTALWLPAASAWLAWASPAASASRLRQGLC